MLLGILFPSINYAANPTNDMLTSLLGEMPEKLPLQTDTLEQTPLNNGMRYKIRYFIEPGNTTLGTPDDWGYAYLFIPNLPTGKKYRLLWQCIRMIFIIILVNPNPQA